MIQNILSGLAHLVIGAAPGVVCLGAAAFGIFVLFGLLAQWGE